MKGFYIIKNGSPVETETTEEWAQWIKNQDNRRIGWDVKDGVSVSTVFLGMDHNFLPSGTPVLWETMIFGGEHNDYQERYTSEADAREGHKRAMELAFGKLN
jgi:hypothetical protein